MVVGMREINFRGKVLGNHKGVYEHDWAFGNLIVELETKRVFIVDLSHFNADTKLIDVVIEVIPETVGQYTYLKDKNDVEIYEGDKIAMQWKDGETTYGTVVWLGNGFDLITDCEPMRERFVYKEANGLKVIGNIHDQKGTIKEYVRSAVMSGLGWQTIVEGANENNYDMEEVERYYEYFIEQKEEHKERSSDLYE
jgi:uncharacterized phage protein (TIGR01671 family)